MTRRPRLLDLYCCAGGASMGYFRAGFDVVGVDLDPQPNYPFPFRQADAPAALRSLLSGGTLRFGADLTLGLGDIDAIHASPPCQTHTALTKGNRRREGWQDSHVDLIPDTRRLLEATGLPYLIENVQGAPVRRDIVLCGEMFGLAVIRHRYFELGRWVTTQPDHPKHRGRVAGMRHGEWFEGPYFAVYGEGGGKGSVPEWQDAMGIDWTDVRREIAEAIPPSYAHLLGLRLREHILAMPTVSESLNQAVDE